MSLLRHWPLLGVCLLVVAVAGGRSEPPPAKPAVRTDLYGDPLPGGAIARLGSVRLRHQSNPESVFFLPDGKTLISGNRCPEPIRLWDVATGKELRRFIRHPSPRGGGLFRFAVSPDGKTLAVESYDDGKVHLWEVGTGKELGRIGEDEDGCYDPIVFAPDGRTIAGCSTTSRGGITLWNIRTGKKLRRFESGGDHTRGFMFSPDGRMLATMGYEYPQEKKSPPVKRNRDREEEEPRYVPVVRLWEVATGQERRKFTWEGEDLVGFFPDGKSLVTTHEKGPLRLREIATGEVQRVLGHGASPVAFSRDGRIMAAGSRDQNRIIRIWDTASGKEVGRINSWACSLAFSPDDKTLASVGNGPRVRLWDVATGEEVHPPTDHPGGVTSVAFSPDNKRLASADSNGMVRLWEATTGKMLAGPPKQEHGVHVVSFSPDGKMLAWGDAAGRIHLWDMAKQKVLHVLAKHERHVVRLDWSPDRPLLASGEYEEVTVHLWDTGNGRLVRSLADYDRSFSEVAFLSTAEDTVVTLTWHNHVVFWDEASEEGFAEFNRGDSERSCYHYGRFAPDRRTWAAAAVGGEAGLWDMLTGKQLLAMQLNGHCDWSPAFSPNSRLIAFGGGRQSSMLHIWDLARGKEVRHLEGFSGEINSVAFSADGRLLATGTANGEVLVWDLSLLGIETELPGRNLARPELQKHWSTLAGKSKDGFQATWSLAAGGRQTISLLKDQLQPIPQADAGVVARLIADLDSKDSLTREVAFEHLTKLGPRAEPGVRRALADKPSAEAQARLSEFLHDLRRKMVLIRPGEVMRQVRAVHVLEQIGNPEAKAVLQVLAKGVPAAPQTQHAKAALARLERQATPAKP